MALRLLAKTFRLTRAQLAWITSKALQLDITESAYIRKVIDEKMAQDQKPK